MRRSANVLVQSRKHRRACNRTTAQNAIAAVASIKTLLWEECTARSPQVVGIYLPFPGRKALVNALISSLSSRRPV